MVQFQTAERYRASACLLLAFAWLFGGEGGNVLAVLPLLLAVEDFFLP
jgi:hypothetical protein